MSTQRSGDIDGRPIVVVDGLLSMDQVAEYERALAGTAFVRSESAKPDTAHIKHFVAEMPLANLRQLALLPLTLSALAPFSRNGERWQAYRAYTNLAVYGDLLISHTDCLPGNLELTALWYLNAQWDPEWGGETLFFSDDGDARFVVSPRPGRLVVFDGTIRHVGRPPNRNCHASRYTFAIKLERS